MRKATDVFGEWAKEGKDIGMEKGHSVAVEEMINFALKERQDRGKRFSFLDVGCGNGWVVRSLAKHPMCNKALGIDGAKQMIANAESRGGNAEYILADINSFKPSQKFDLIHSMEVLYYLEDPKNVINAISKIWLNEGGRLIIGLDHYYENTVSHSWQQEVGTKMLMLKSEEWVEAFKEAGLVDVKTWYSDKKKDWSGTLVITGKNKKNGVLG